MSLKDLAKNGKNQEEKKADVIENKEEKKVEEKTADAPAAKELVKKEHVSTDIAHAGLAYATRMLYKLKKDFMEANQALGLDFVYMGQWLVTNKKGQFVERDNPAVNYGDKIRVIIGSGEERFTLWGKQESPEEGNLLISEKTIEEAQDKFDEIADTLTPGVYKVEDIQSRYLATVLPEDSLTSDSPKIYMMNFSPTSKLAFGKWARDLFAGTYAAVGFPRGTCAPSVIVEISTVEKKGPSYTYITFEFLAVKMFTE